MKTTKRVLRALSAALALLMLLLSLQGEVRAADSALLMKLSDTVGKTYVLEAHNGKYVSIAGASLETAATANLWERTDGLNQRWRVSLADADFCGYLIQSVNSDKFLDVAGISRASGADIYQWDYTGADNQLWYLEDAGGGYVFIRSGMGTYMDVDHSGTANGTNIWAYDFNGTDAQRFKIREVDSSGAYVDAEIISADDSWRNAAASRAPLLLPDTAGKTYVLEARNGKYVNIADASLETGATAQIWEQTDGFNQRWRIILQDTLEDTGYLGYMIQSVNSDKYLDVAGIAWWSEADIYQWDYTGADNQLWYLEDAGNGYVFIRSGMGTYMDVANNGTENGVNIWAYDFNGTDAQRFKIREVDSSGAYVDAALVVAGDETITNLLNHFSLDFGMDEDEAAAWQAYRDKRLTEPEARRIVNAVNELRKGQSVELSVSYGDKTMKFFIEVFGRKPADGYPVYFALHDGGTNKWVNNWNYISLRSRYRPECGICIVPRAIANTRNAHVVKESFPLYDRLIEYLILTERVNPNRVYLTGYGVGGDGVYDITSKMADRFAAANVTAGHPGSANLLNLRNLPLQLQVGDRDSAQRRNILTVKTDAKLSGLAHRYGGYKHRTYVHYNTKHGAVPDYQTTGTVYTDAAVWRDHMGVFRRVVPSISQQTVNPSIFDFMNQYTRDPLPKRVVWDLSARAASRSVESFYYLAADAQVTDGVIVAEYDRNTNHVMLKTDGVTGDFRILLNRRMVDFSRPVVFVVDGKRASLSLSPNDHLLTTTTAERGDPYYQFKAAVSYTDLLKLVG